MLPWVSAPGSGLGLFVAGLLEILTPASAASRRGGLDSSSVSCLVVGAKERAKRQQTETRVGSRIY